MCVMAKVANDFELATTNFRKKNRERDSENTKL